ncbi:PH domain-containing protein [Umezawaea sp. Da 62-37]|uniref:PH domain-containing protein n=1 Tax=Umezawaea sp. Da 62-37 TaxID=3075927 RepID=UPI0028F71BEB|nr:PH domain-containing protein [Umezawaea sp. Da 62-37]WNV82817.1 PH domain-containing protein [Umezawaea sp. Da 62-37]
MTSPELPMAPEFVEEPPALDWHRLDLRMLIVRPLNELLGLIPVLVGLLVIGGGDVWRIAMSGGFIVLVVLFGLLNWLTTRYRITHDQVELHTGLLVRKRLAVPRERIRTVDLTAKLGHRLFGLSAIRVGTGQHEKAGDNGGVTLDAVSSQEAERLRQLLLDRAPARAVGDAPARQVSTPLAVFDPRWLRFAPLTLSGLVAVGGTFGVLMNYAQEFDLRPSAFGGLHAVVERVVNAPIVLTVMTVLGVVLVLAVIASLLVYVVQFWGYRLTREDDGTLRVRRGLLTTRSVSVDEDRLRGVEVQEPLLLRLGRGARTTAVATGLGTKGESSLLLPPAPVAEAHRVAGDVLRVGQSPTRTGLLRHPLVALRRRIVRAVLPVLVLVGVLVLVAPSWTWQAALVLVPFAALLGWDRYRALGHALTERYLVARSGSAVRETVALQRSGIIGWRISQSFFQRRAGLATVSATTAAGDGVYHVIDVDARTGLLLADEAVPDLLRPFLVVPESTP